VPRRNGTETAPASQVGTTCPLSQEQLDVAQAEAEHMVQSDGMADDIGGKAIAAVRVGGGFMPRVLPVSTPTAIRGYRDNAVAAASLSAASLQFNGKLTHPLRDFGRASWRSRPSHERPRPSPLFTWPVQIVPIQKQESRRVGRSPCTVAATARSLRLYADALRGAEIPGGSMFDFISRRANTEGLRRGAPHERRLRRLGDSLWHLLWRRQHISLAGHLAIAILLMAVSAPRLAEIFAPAIANASPGVVFDVTFDCNQRFSIGDDPEINIEGQASGSIGLNWYALEDDCKSLRLSVPVVEAVSTGPRSPPQGYRIDTPGADRHGHRPQDRPGSVVGVPDLYRRQDDFRTV
jgi:hypothetical protein